MKILFALAALWVLAVAHYVHEDIPGQDIIFPGMRVIRAPNYEPLNEHNQLSKKRSPVAQFYIYHPGARNQKVTEVESADGKSRPS